MIRHAQAGEAKGFMVVPLWPSAPVWPLLCPYNAGSFAVFVREARELPQIESLFLPGLSGATLFNGEVPNTHVLAISAEKSLVWQFLTWEISKQKSSLSQDLLKLRHV